MKKNWLVLVRVDKTAKADGNPKGKGYKASIGKTGDKDSVPAGAGAPAGVDSPKEKLNLYLMLKMLLLLQDYLMKTQFNRL